MNLKKARILITGASGGIGQALTAALQAEGASLLLQGRSRECPTCADGDRWIQADLTTTYGRNAVRAQAQSFGINVVINNAGINQFSAFEDADIDNIITTNVIAPMRLVQVLLPQLRQLPAASIVNVGSTFGEIGFAGYVAYSASKHAIKGFSEALRRELADSNIQVQHISPRATATEMNADNVVSLNETLGTGVDDPEVLATHIIKTLKNDKRHLQMGAMERFQILLNALLPGVVDNALSKQLSTIRDHFPSSPRVSAGDKPVSQVTAIDGKVIAINKEKVS